MNMAYDPHNTYSLPYFWNGRYSIQQKAYPNEQFDSWSDLYQSKYKMTYYLLTGQRNYRVSFK